MLVDNKHKKTFLENLVEDYKSQLHQLKENPLGT